MGLIYDAGTWSKLKNRNQAFPLFIGSGYFSAAERSPVLNFVSVTANDLFNGDAFRFKPEDQTVVFVFETSSLHGMAEQRRMFIEFFHRKMTNPVIIKRNYEVQNKDDFRLYAAADTGALFLDGLGEGLWLTTHQKLPKAMVNNTAFGILQATRTRISKTEYISCPSCGRTLFDLQETTARRRSRTDHLQGVKIGIMGCIVNGPGEMADADYGYVGTAI